MQHNRKNKTNLCFISHNNYYDLLNDVNNIKQETIFHISTQLRVLLSFSLVYFFIIKENKIDKKPRIHVIEI